MALQPGPWVDRGEPEAKPWLNNHGVVKFIEFPVRIPEMSRRAFHLHWLKHHSPHVMNVTGFSQFMRKYSTGHVYPEPVLGLPRHFRQDTPFEGAAEVWISSLDETSDWLAHPLYAELVQPDEPRFIAHDGRVEVVLTKEERLYESDADLHETGLTKLYLIVRGRDRSEHDAMHERISGFARRMLDRPALKRRLRQLVVSHALRLPLPEGFPTADIDAVMELWFDDAAVLADFYLDPAWGELCRAEQEAVDVADIRAVVARMHVVHDEFSFQPSTTQPLRFTLAY